MNRNFNNENITLVMEAMAVNRSFEFWVFQSMNFLFLMAESREIRR